MAYRGLELAGNLSEPLQDNQSLINLGGPGIDEDLSIFVNNLKNRSTLLFDSSDQGTSLIPSSSESTGTKRFMFSPEVPFIFTNGDVIEIEVRDPTTNGLVGRNVSSTDDAVEYRVVDFEFGLGPSESQRAFGISETLEGSPVDLAGISNNNVVFIRDDGVTQRNILNIATPEIINSAENQGFATSGSRDFFSYNVSDDFNSEINEIEDNIDQANFKRRKKYSISRSISTDDNIRLAGALIVDDPANVLTSDDDFNNPKVPGIFVTDPFSDITNIQKARAFSTLGNPWDENTAESSLDTPSTQVNIGDLRFEGSIEIDGLSVSDYESIAVSSFTHKIPITVSGVEYFLLLTTP